MLPLTCAVTLAAWLSAACAAPVVPTGADAMAGTSAELQAIVRAVRDDAARRSGVGTDRTTVLLAEPVTWPDGSLGCPEPGRLYTQALVPGWRIRIAAGADTHAYHASARGGAWLWCPPGRVAEPVPDPRT